MLQHNNILNSIVKAIIHLKDSRCTIQRLHFEAFHLNGTNLESEPTGRPVIYFCGDKCHRITIPRTCASPQYQYNQLLDEEKEKKALLYDQCRPHSLFFHWLSLATHNGKLNAQVCAYNWHSSKLTQVRMITCAAGRPNYWWRKLGNEEKFDTESF